MSTINRSADGSITVNKGGRDQFFNGLINITTQYDDVTIKVISLADMRTIVSFVYADITEINGEAPPGTIAATAKLLSDTVFFPNAGVAAGDLYLYPDDFYGAYTDMHDADWLLENPVGSQNNPLRVRRLSTLSAPAITFGTVTSGLIPVIIGSVANADNYVLLRNTIDDPLTATEIYNGTDLTYDDTDVEPETEYFYYAKAQGEGYNDSQLGRGDATTPAASTSIFTHVTNVNIDEEAKQGTSTGTALSAFALLAPIADGETVIAYHDTSGDTLISDIEIMMSDANNPATGQRLGGFFVNGTVIQTVDNGVENYTGNDIHDDYFYVKRVGNDVQMGYDKNQAPFYTAVGVLTGLSNVYVWFKFKVPVAGQYLTNITVE